MTRPLPGVGPDCALLIRHASPFRVSTPRLGAGQRGRDAAPPRH